MKTICK